MFNAIKTAIFKKVLVTFSYFGSSGGYTQRTVEPLKLVFKGKDWYLYGFCRLRKDFRFFKLTVSRALPLGKKLLCGMFPLICRLKHLFTPKI